MMQYIKRYRNDVVVCLLYTFLLFSFFYRVFVNGEVFYSADNLLITIPSRLLLVDSLKSFVFPLWNRFLFSGTPFLSDINLALLYPSNILFAFFEPFTALTLDIVLHVFFAMTGMYCAAKMLSRSTTYAFLGGILYGLSGTIITYTGNIPMLHVAALFPWVFSFWLLVIQKQTGVRMVLVSLLWALQIIAGHPQLTFYASVFSVLYFLWTGKHKIKQQIFVLGVIVLLTFLLSSVQVLPFLESAFSSTRMSGSLSYASFGSTRIVDLIRLFMPSFVGNARMGTEWLAGGSVYGYIGSIALLFLIYRVWKSKKSFFYWSTLFSFLLSFGAASPLFLLAFYSIPGFGFFRVPMHFLLITTFSGILLLITQKDDLLNIVLPRYMRFIFLLLSVLSIVGAIFFPHLLSLFNIPLIETILAKKPFLEEMNIVEIFQQIGIHAAVLCIGLFLFLQVAHKQYKKVLFFCFCTAELLVFSSMGVITKPKSIVQPLWSNMTSLSDSLARYPNEDGRWYVHPSVYNNPVKRVYGEQTLFNETIHQLAILRPNVSVVSGLSLVDGYASMIPARYQDYFGTIAKDPTGVTIPSVSLPQLDALHVRYMIADPKSVNEELQGWEFVQPYGRYAVYKNTEAYPFARVVNGEKTKTASYRWISANTVSVTANASTSGQLVLSQFVYPGWSAKDSSGNTYEIKPYDTYFQSITIPPSENTYEFSYMPKSIILGSVLSGISLLGSFVLLSRSFFHRFVQKHKK